MSRFTEEQDEITFSEPILAQKGVRCGISFAEGSAWEVKPKAQWSHEQAAAMNGLIGKKFDACKLTIQISDDSVRTEHANAKPKLTIEDQFNLEKYPFPDKETGLVRYMSKQRLYELEGALGFDPVFMCDGQYVAPFITKNGNKVAPKVEGKEVTRKLNPDFFGAYFTITRDDFGNEHAVPNPNNWIGKTIYCDIGVEQSEKFGPKNVVARYVKAPAGI